MKALTFARQFHISRAHHKGRSRCDFVDHATDHGNRKTKTDQDNTTHSAAGGADPATAARGSERAEEGTAVERHVSSSRSADEHLENEDRADRPGHYELPKRFRLGIDALQCLAGADIGENYQTAVQQVCILDLELKSNVFEFFGHFTRYSTNHCCCLF